LFCFRTTTVVVLLLKRHAIHSDVPPIVVIRNLPALIRHGCAAEGASGSQALQPLRADGVDSKSQSTTSHPMPTTMVSSIDGPELVCLQLRPTGCHHLSLQMGFNLSIQVGMKQSLLPQPLHRLKFLLYLLLIEARSAGRQ